MATIDTTKTMNLAEIKGRLNGSDPMGMIIDEVVNENELLQVLPMVECNKGSYHETRLWAGDPRATWVAVGDRVKSDHASTRVIADTPARAKILSSTNEDVIQIFAHIKDGGEQKQQMMLKRMQEEIAFQRALSNEACEKLIYGDRSTNPLVINGLSKRFSYKCGEQRIDDQIIDGTNSDTSSTDLTSIFMVVMDSQNGVTGIYPKGTTGGISYEDKGRSKDTNEEGSCWNYDGLYTLDMGLCVRSSLAVVRIANISVNTVKSDSTKLIQDLIDASERTKARGKVFFLCNGKIRTALRQGLVGKPNNFFDSTDIAGKKITTFDDIPLLRVDAILTSEAREIK